VHVQDRQARTAADHHHASASSALKRLVDAVAVHLKPKPDLSLANEKFSDSFEREHAELLLRRRW
jgi:hypothetical protein